MWGQIEMRQQYEYSGRNTNRRKRNRDCLINWMLKSGHRQTKCLKTAPESPRAAMWSILPEAKLPILSSKSKSSFPLQFIQAYLLPACGPTLTCLKTTVWVWQNSLLLIWQNSFEREKKKTDLQGTGQHKKVWKQRYDIQIWYRKQKMLKGKIK